MSAEGDTAPSAPASSRSSLLAAGGFALLMVVAVSGVAGSFAFDSLVRSSRDATRWAVLLAVPPIVAVTIVTIRWRRSRRRLPTGAESACLVVCLAVFSFAVFGGAVAEEGIDPATLSLTERRHGFPERYMLVAIPTAAVCGLVAWATDRRRRDG